LKRSFDKNDSFHSHVFPHFLSYGSIGSVDEPSVLAQSGIRRETAADNPMLHGRKLYAVSGSRLGKDVFDVISCPDHSVVEKRAVFRQFVIIDSDVFRLIVFRYVYGIFRDISADQGEYFPKGHLFCIHWSDWVKIA
jgi:hypothetical protein